MKPESTPPGEAYFVSCYNCQASFDALGSNWCSCLVSKRTLVCSSCLTCFCKAPTSYRQKFWELAPQSLWDRVIAEGKTAYELPPNPSPEDVPRRWSSSWMTSETSSGWRCRSGASATASSSPPTVWRAWRLAKKYRPDLILADAFMPKLDGREMCRRLKTAPETTEIKVVIMTGIYTAARYKSEAFRVFLADDYLAKPLQFRELSDVLQKHLAGATRN
jgi:CheY-like chemotaxis protein